MKRLLLLLVLLIPAAYAQSLYGVTYIDVTPNWVPDTTKLLNQFAADSRKDPGCVRVEILQQDGRPNHLVILEVWQSRKAFEDHSALEHTKQFREKLFPMLGSPYDQRLHTALP